MLDLLLILRYSFIGIYFVKKGGKKMQIFDPRQIMSSPDFEIFHYKDAKLDGVAVHQHDFYEIYFFISGNVEYNVEGHTYHLQSGDILLINPLELHQPRIRPGQSPYERIVLWINRGYLSRLCSNQTSLSRCFDSSVPGHTNLFRLAKPQQAYIYSKLRELLKESTNNDYGNDLVCQAELIRLLVELNRLATDITETKKEKTVSPLIENVTEYINNHYCEKITLDSIAEEFFVSKYYLSHLFNKTVGTSIHRYIILKRLVNAKQMLSSGIKPTTASANCGFSDYAGFYRAFTSEYGITPKQYAQIYNG